VTFIIGTPHAKGAGYFINNKNLGVGHGREEADIRTCVHCQAIIKMQEWRHDGAWCNRCNAPICGNNNPLCVAENKAFGCVPFLKKLEMFTRGQVSLTMFKRLAGLDSPPPPPAPRIVLPGGK
jgi:hypothetical protein